MAIEILDIPSAKEDIEQIKREVPTEELYKLLAEESSELAQAALKMCRLGNSSNPTDKDPLEAYNNLIEEYTDVLGITMCILDLKPDWVIANYKFHRWRSRLDKAKEGFDEQEGTVTESD